jgi:D-alanine-D-alanine ligase
MKRSRRRRARPRKRVAVLYEVWWPQEEPVPPRAPLGAAPPEPVADDGAEAEAHEDILQALRATDYLPFRFELDGTKETLTKLARTPASVIFNLTESYAGDDTKDFHVAAYLELLGTPYTGNGPRGLHLGQDKALAKRVLNDHGVPTPPSVLIEKGGERSLDSRSGFSLTFPLIVKPSREDGSIGIDSGAVVVDRRQLRERIDFVLEHFRGGALVERYVEGREVYVSIVDDGESRSPRALPLVEIDLSRLPDGVPRIAGSEVKWWKGTDIYRNTPPVYPSGISSACRARLARIALAAYRALGLRDYARVDMRLSADGEGHVIEVNPNPWLNRDGEFVMAWTQTGRSYEELIAHLVGLALSRGDD